ncbi:MAG: hypothetical protein ACP5IY_02700, partial [Halothiobacillaceae bacterium]
MNPDRIQLEPSWKAALADEFAQDYMTDLRAFLLAELKAGKRIHPNPDEWFNAFNHTPLDKVRVVILGQDPYPTPGHAHGLCFSVRPPEETLNHSAFPVWGRTPQREQRHQSLI